MQEFEQALEQELAVISTLQGRIYPLSSPEANAKQGVPYIIYGSSEGVRDKSLDGYLDSKEVRAELNIVAARYEHMKVITKQVIAILLSFEQRQIGTDGPYIEELTYEAPVELFEEKPNLYRGVVEFTLYFNEED